MRFGVNYTPSQGWFHSWLDFDPDSVRHDFEAIARLGVDHVRIFPLWPIVQPSRSLIRSAALSDIGSVVDIAGEFGLDVNVDALQGHLSSFDFLPSWVQSWHRRNIFTDTQVVNAEAHYIRTLARSLNHRPNLLGITLGNELNQFASPPHPFPHSASEAQIDRWLAQLVAAARAETTSLVTHALYDAAWFDDAQPFTPAQAAAVGDATIVHSWVFNGTAQRHGALGVGSIRHAEYELQLAAAWHDDPKRPLWLQEVGAPTNVIPAANAPEFLEFTIRRALTVHQLQLITWWSSHDVSRGLVDFPELEYDLGLFDAEGRLKPTGARYAELIAEFHSAPTAAASSVGIVLDDTQPNYRAYCAPGGPFNEGWLALATRLEVSPQVVLKSRLGSVALLEGRGITSLSHLTPQQHPVSVDAESATDADTRKEGSYA